MTMQRPRLDPEDGLWSPKRRTLTGGLVLTITLVAFEALAISTVMPEVARELNGITSYGWVFTAFMLGSLIGIVVSGGLIDRRGLAMPFAAGLGLFAIGLVIGGLSPSMEVLIFARFIQGLGAGAIPPIAYVAIGRTMPEHLRPVMFATLSTAWVLPGVFGPAIAGAVGELVGWRAVFLGLLPLIAIAAIISFPAIRRIGPAEAAADDEAAAAASLRRRLPRALLVAIGTGLFLAGLTSGGPFVLLGVAIPAWLVAAVGVLIGIPAIRSLTPPGTLVAARGMPAAVLLRGVLTFMFFGVDAYISLVLVTWRGQSLTEAGITLTAATLAWTAGSWIQARYSRRWPPERFVRAGFVVVVVGLTSFMSVLSPDVPVWVALPTFAIAGLGMGLAYSPLALIVLRDAPGGEQGSASAAISLTDTLGTALGIGVTGALIAAAVRGAAPTTTGLALGFAVAIGVGVIGALLSWRLRPSAPPVVASTPVIATPSPATGQDALVG
jgi:MFS family permease